MAGAVRIRANPRMITRFLWSAAASAAGTNVKSAAGAAALHETRVPRECAVLSLRYET